jgi:hypothetical protein
MNFPPHVVCSLLRLNGDQVIWFLEIAFLVIYSIESWPSYLMLNGKNAICQ